MLTGAFPQRSLVAKRIYKNVKMMKSMNAVELEGLINGVAQEDNTDRL